MIKRKSVFHWHYSGNYQRGVYLAGRYSAILDTDRRIIWGDFFRKGTGRNGGIAWEYLRKRKRP